jgi:hypothetical protein
MTIATRFVFYSVEPTLIHYDDSNQTDKEITLDACQNLSVPEITGEPTLGSANDVEKELNFQSGTLVGTGSVDLLELAGSGYPYSSLVLVVNESKTASINLSNGTAVVTIDPGMPCLLKFSTADEEPKWSIASSEDNTPVLILACGDWEAVPA